MARPKLSAIEAYSYGYGTAEPDRVIAGGTHDLYPFTRTWTREDHIRSVDTLKVTLSPGNPFQVTQALTFGHRLHLVYDDGTVVPYRIREVTTGTGSQSSLTISCRALEADLTNRQFFFVKAPNATVSHLLPLTDRTVQEALDIIFDSDYGCPVNFELASVKTEWQSLSCDLYVNGSNLNELLQRLQEDVLINHEIELEYDTVWSGGVLFFFFREKGWSSGERASGVVTPTKRPIEAPTGRIRRRYGPDAHASGSTANRVFSKFSESDVQYFNRLIPFGGVSLDDRIDIGGIYWPVESMTLDGSGNTIITFEDDLIYAPDLYASPAGMSHFLTGENVLNGQVDIVSVQVPNVIVALGDVRAETGGWKVVDFAGSGKNSFGRDVTYVYDPATPEPFVERTVFLQNTPPYDNLFETLVEGSADMSTLFDGVPLGMNAVGGALLDTTTEARFVTHGTRALHAICPAEGDAVKTDLFTFTPEDVEIYLSAWTLIQVTQGRATMYFEDLAGNKYPNPESGELYAAASQQAMQMAFGGEEPPEGDLFLTIIALEDNTEFYIDALTITQSVSFWEYAEAMGKRALYQKAASVLFTQGVVPNISFETEFIDVSEYDGTEFLPVLAGSWASIKDLHDPTSATYGKEVTGRAETIVSGGPGPGGRGTPWRHAKFESVRPSLARRLAGGVRVSTPGERAPNPRFPRIPGRPVSPGGGGENQDVFSVERKAGALCFLTQTYETAIELEALPITPLRTDVPKDTDLELLSTELDDIIPVTTSEDVKAGVESLPIYIQRIQATAGDSIKRNGALNEALLLLDAFKALIQVREYREVDALGLTTETLFGVHGGVDISPAQSDALAGAVLKITSPLGDVRKLVILTADVDEDDEHISFGSSTEFEEEMPTGSSVEVAGYHTLGQFKATAGELDLRIRTETAITTWGNTQRGVLLARIDAPSSGSTLSVEPTDWRIAEDTTVTILVNRTNYETVPAGESIFEPFVRVVDTEEPVGSTALSLSSSVTVYAGDMVVLGTNALETRFVVQETFINLVQGQIQARVSEIEDLQIAQGNATYNGTSRTTVAITGLTRDVRTHDQFLIYETDTGRVTRITASNDLTATGGAQTLQINSQNVWMKPGSPIHPGTMSQLTQELLGWTFAGRFSKSDTYNGTIDAAGNITTPGTAGWALTGAGDADITGNLNFGGVNRAGDDGIELRTSASVLDPTRSLSLVLANGTRIGDLWGSGTSVGASTLHIDSENDMDIEAAETLLLRAVGNDLTLVANNGNRVILNADESTYIIGAFDLSIEDSPGRPNDSGHGRLTILENLTLGVVPAAGASMFTVGTNNSVATSGYSTTATRWVRAFIGGNWYRLLAVLD